MMGSVEQRNINSHIYKLLQGENDHHLSWLVTVASTALTLKQAVDLHSQDSRDLPGLQTRKYRGACHRSHARAPELRGALAN
jgi:hypothetical protein